MNLSLKGKNAIICGSSQGIGLAIAEELAQLGASCILLSRDDGKLKNAVAKLSLSEGQHHTSYAIDLSDPVKLGSLIDDIVSRIRVHVLVNNSGGPAAGPITEATEEQFLNAFNQHIIASHILTRAVSAGMKEEGYGRIINIISTSVKIPLKNLGVSNTIRGAMASWAKTMSNELGAFNITVNNVLPGFTRTERLEAIIDNTSSKTGKEKNEVELKMMSEVPLQRFGEASEIAAVAAFLATPAAAYVNGTSIPVDGGRTGSI
jgi:3-oxoacyl-[acyl-carrier protein] reductase